ncbi:uncharacterized protein C8R40DRAFT_820520 [Lentinula edodes]|uniref:uncharacterized protein n=1 Tax=Lentinula edodes TaxID=5353 RepID=UPI001E8EBC36|nr:uncharacterized protein C8R40DRAFT_820520 [Lentinula edodes]KAH7868578.1 hypothetical protein C8R40DRAFT_820520 [Lentinula edodes]
MDCILIFILRNTRFGPPSSVLFAFACFSFLLRLSFCFIPGLGFVPTQFQPRSSSWYIVHTLYLLCSLFEKTLTLVKHIESLGSSLVYETAQAYIYTATCSALRIQSTIVIKDLLQTE